ncbi:43647_t:CDS:1, partial [Gigaspora margarita]
QVAHKVLLISATSAASKQNWPVYGFIHSKLHNQILSQKADRLIYIYWNTQILCWLGRSVNSDNQEL